MNHSKIRCLSLALSLLLVWNTPLFAEDASARQVSENEVQVDFARDIAPILSKNCVACHNAKKAEGGLSLEDHASLMKGGDSGAVVQADDFATSALILRVTDEADLMPPPDNTVGAQKLTEPEVALLLEWITAGSKPSSDLDAMAMEWQPLAVTVQPIYALATSSDGNFVAFGRGNEAFVERLSQGNALETFELTDVRLTESLTSVEATSAEREHTAAHLDIVQSIAFDPTTQLVTTGGYRTVKFWRRLLEPTRTLKNLAIASRITSISPDGSKVAVVSGDHSLEIIEIQSGTGRRFLNSHQATITTICWSADSSRLLSADAAGVLCWTDSQQSQVLKGDNTTKLLSLLDVGGQRFLAISEDRKLVEILVDAQQSQSSRTLDGFENIVGLQVHPASNLLAIGIHDGAVRIHNLTDYSLIRELDVGGKIVELALSGDGALLCPIVEDPSGRHLAKLWRLSDGVQVAELSSDYEYSRLASVAEREAARQKSLVEHWNAQLPELTKAKESEIEAQMKLEETKNKALEDLATKDTELAQAMQAIADAETAVAQAEDAAAEAAKQLEAKRTELEEKRKLSREAEDRRTKAAEELAKREQALATATDAVARAASRIPEAEQIIARESERLQESQAKVEAIRSDPLAAVEATLVAFSDDSSRLILADNLSRLHIFATSDGRPLANLKLDANAVALSAAANGWLCISDTGNFQEWLPKTPWQLVRTLGNYRDSPISDRVTALDFSMDGSRLAIGSGPPSRFGDVKIVDATSGDIVLDLGQPHSDSVLCVRFSPDDRWLATAGADKLCRVFDAANGEQRFSFEGHTHHVLAVAWRDDARALVTGSADNSIKVWNIDSGTQERTISVFNKEVTALAYVGQSNQFAASSASGEVKLIDAANGQVVRAFSGAEGAVATLATSPDGTLLIAGGQSGKKWIWQIADGKLIESK